MKSSPRHNRQTSRRHFIQTSAVAGAALLGSWPGLNAFADAVAPAPARTAVDQVPLGKTGLQICRLGIGTGSDGGRIQHALGKAAFTDLIHYAYDHGITYIDAAQMYATFPWVGDAIKGLPREKLFLQSKIMGVPGDALATIDYQRKVYNTDYIDSLLVHCMIDENWTDEWKRAMDGYSEAKERKWIRAKGVSCHSLPALRTANASDWNEVHLVRVNPQGVRTDGEAQEVWPADNPRQDVTPVMAEIKRMHAKGRGIIGMKIIGDGAFVNHADREKSIRFAMACKDIDAIVIGFTKKEQIDDAIERINRALKEV